MEDLSDVQKDKVALMLSFSEKLHNADLRKEYFHSFMNSPNSTVAKEYLRRFRLFADSYPLNKFDSCLTMLKNREPYINFFLLSLPQLLTLSQIRSRSNRVVTIAPAAISVPLAGSLSGRTCFPIRFFQYGSHIPGRCSGRFYNRCSLLRHGPILP